MVFSDGDTCNQQSWQTCVPYFCIKWEFGVLVFVEGWKLENPEKKPWSMDENQQQTQPTCDARSRNWTQATVVGDECSHCCAIPGLLLWVEDAAH